MKMPKSILLLPLLLLQLTLPAQVQWYQNQDGSFELPNITIASSVHSFTPNSFIACYLWSLNNDNYTWKISKTHINGTEQHCFFITGTTAMVEAKVGQHNSVYVLERNYPIGQNTEYIVYKLDSNLVVRAQRNIVFPNNYNIFNLNAFELDDDDNVYFAGDGQFPDGAGFRPASFVLKTDKNLVTKWSRIENSQTSFTGLHIDRYGNVLVVADFYTFFPDVHITKISENGQYAQTRTVHTDAGRFSLYSTLDDDDNLLLYGGKSTPEGAQAMYLYKISRITGNIIYSKTHFTAPGMQLDDLKLDRYGNIFSLVTQYLASGNQLSKISRINPNTGNIYWTHSISYDQDSCNLVKLVVNETDRFYVVGARTSHTYFSKGFAIRMNKNGQMDGDFPAPDSVAFQRSHSLVDGITDRNNQLIAIGSTNDLDTSTFNVNYERAFAVRYSINPSHGHGGTGKGEGETTATNGVTTTEEDVVINTRAVVYPNPVQNVLTVTVPNPGEYDRITVFNMQGALLFQRSLQGTTATIDVSNFTDGVYLLTLRSSATLKEKAVKFVVKK